MITTTTNSATITADFTAIPATESATVLSYQDKNFSDAAAKSGNMEVMMGELAATNAANAKVKGIGQ